MNKALKYMPVFRGLQEELKVLKSYDFSKNIYPCLEIIKEVDRLPPKRKISSKKISKPVIEKSFESVYIPLIKDINSEKIFIDLPISLKESGNMKKESLLFVRKVIGNRIERTKYLQKLAPLAEKVVPVISTYFHRTGEGGSIKLQNNDLRPYFKVLAFRVFENNFHNDLSQILDVATDKDYIIMDWGETTLDFDDTDQCEINTELSRFPGTIIIHRNAIPKSIKNVGLDHGKRVSSIDNGLIEIYKDLNGHCFSDYSGIKKNDLHKGGTISPGFLYYDAVKNRFYGFKGFEKKLSEFEETIVPDLVKSNATKRMLAHTSEYLGPKNKGWETIENINLGIENGKSAAKFKKIGIEHYLHCIQTRILNGDFD